MPYHKLIEEILTMNAARAEEFMSNHSVRQLLRADYPVEVMATMCMDGRVNITHMSEIPFGVVTPLRNIGGMYQVGWPLMNFTLNEWYEYARQKERLPLLLITYHWSDGDPHRGCAGFQYNRAAAEEYLINFKKEIMDCYGGRIWPVLIGIETDEQALVVHGEGSERLDVRSWADQGDEHFFETHLQTLLLNLPSDARRMLAKLLAGNAHHVKKLRAYDRLPAEYDHCERVLALGQGFDWLDRPNLALIIGPCDPDLGKPIVTAASIIRSNMHADRIPHNGGVLLVSTPYRRRGQRTAAIKQSQYLARLATEHIAIALPDMKDFFHPLFGVLDYNTRRFEPIEGID